MWGAIWYFRYHSKNKYLSFFLSERPSLLESLYYEIFVIKIINGKCEVLLGKLGFMENPRTTILCNGFNSWVSFQTKADTSLKHILGFQKYLQSQEMMMSPQKGALKGTKLQWMQFRYLGTYCTPVQQIKPSELIIWWWVDTWIWIFFVFLQILGTIIHTLLNSRSICCAEVREAVDSL